jgi:DNA-binding beta-propeller fold protein YncE
LIVPNPFAQAILFFRGGTDGDEPPIRVIQGPKTVLSQPDNVAVDAVHREIYVAQFTTDSILVFRSDVAGDVEPIRILHGPNTKLDRPIRVEVDPINNLIAVVTDSALVVFNRTDKDDAAPKWVISGPSTGVGTRFGTRDVKLYPEGKKIVAGGAIGSRRASRQRGAENQGGGAEGFFGGGASFIGVWKYGDNGDIAPWVMLKNSPITKLVGSRLALNPDKKELIVGGDGQVNGYHMPEIF